MHSRIGERGASWSAAGAPGLPVSALGLSEGQPPHAEQPRRRLGRLGRPEDIAPVVGWLISETAGWVSGQTVRANGAMF
jgi:3-oxoacyl-[acyl-carrier protein] reductase